MEIYPKCYFTCVSAYLFQAVTSFDKLLAAHPQSHINLNIALVFYSISKGQFIVGSFDSKDQFIVGGFDSCYKLLPALTAVTSCWQLHLNFITTSTLLRYLIPSLRVNSLSPSLTAVTAVASFASCCKLLPAQPQLHFNISIA